MNFAEDGMDHQFLISSCNAILFFENTVLVLCGKVSVDELRKGHECVSSWTDSQTGLLVRAYMKQADYAWLVNKL